MLRGDSEIECLLEELDDGSFVDYERVFSVKMWLSSTLLLH
jgi:hypothetical protein